MTARGPSGRPRCNASAPNRVLINMQPKEREALATLDQVRLSTDRMALAAQHVFLFTLAAGVMVLLAAVQATRDERMFESAVRRAGTLAVPSVMNHPPVATLRGA
jgi:hypothetical protein